MIHVNQNFLDTLLDPLLGLADVDEKVEAYKELDPNNPSMIRSVIRELIVPYANSLPTEIRERVKMAYMYYLSTNKVDFGRIFDSVLPPFDPPKDPRLIFVWIWEECFPGEDYLISDLELFSEIKDANEPLRLWIRYSAEE